MASSPRRASRRFRRMLLLAGSCVFSLGLAEVALRVFLPASLFVNGRDTEGWTENTPTFDAFMSIDARIGYVPKRSTQLYDERGLCRDRPADEALPRGGKNVLWIGDSVTARRFVEREVRRRSAAPFTSWCGGVEGYNATQTLGYYQTVLRPLHPDAVVFTLHHNDWWNTPVVFYDDEQRVHCRTLDREVGWFSPFWFRHSYLYRLLFSWLTAASAEHKGEVADAMVTNALRELRDVLAADSIPFTVLVLPPMRAEEKWSEEERARHAMALRLLRDLGVNHVDLLPGLRAGLAAKVDVQQMPNDWMHPSEAVAGYLAAEVVQAGILPPK